MSYNPERTQGQRPHYKASVRIINLNHNQKVKAGFTL
jgi:hypothetical protein